MSWIEKYLADSLQYLSRPPQGRSTRPSLPAEMPKGVVKLLSLLAAFIGKAVLDWFCNTLLRWTLRPLFDRVYAIAPQIALWSGVLFCIGQIGELRTRDHSVAELEMWGTPQGNTISFLAKPYLKPVHANLNEVDLTELPENWQSRKLHKVQYFENWCKRNDTPDCEDIGRENVSRINDSAFVLEWSEQRTVYLRTTHPPDLRDKNLGRANLEYAFLPGADFRRADLREATLNYAWLENADFREADLVSSNLEGAMLAGANLEKAFVSGYADRPLELAHADLSDTNWSAAALRHTDLTGATMNSRTDLRNSFGDGTVILPANVERPCQWSNEVLDDHEFFGRWRGWVDNDKVKDIQKSPWIWISPSAAWDDVNAKFAGDPNCAWKSEALPGVATHPNAISR